VPHRLRQIVVGQEPQLVVVAEHMAIVLRCQIAIVVVSVGCAADSAAAAAEACQGVLVGPQCLGVGYGLGRHMVLTVAVVAEERADAVQVCFRAVGSVVAASDLEVAHTEAVLRLVGADNVAAVAGAREERLEVVGMIGLPVAAQSIAVDLVVAGLSRVSAELWYRRVEMRSTQGCDVPYPPFSGGAASSQSSFESYMLATHEDRSSRPAVVGFHGILTWLRLK
jgi:hypothetical protein